MDWVKKEAAYKKTDRWIWFEYKGKEDIPVNQQIGYIYNPFLKPVEEMFEMWKDINDIDMSEPLSNYQVKLENR